MFVIIPIKHDTAALGFVRLRSRRRTGLQHSTARFQYHSCTRRPLEGPIAFSERTAARNCRRKMSSASQARSDQLH